MSPNPADTLANLVRKLLKSPRASQLAPSFRTALIRALADYDSIGSSIKILNEDMEFERPMIKDGPRCAHCGTPFPPKRVTQIYCTPKCRISAGNLRNNAKRPMGVGRTLTP